jgi:asparagine synthase (glutamine-hydrolysing)
MCGIAGYVTFSVGRPDPDVLSAMAMSLRRRGPDAGGTITDGACGMAHRRLSIIDLAGSYQPMRLEGNDISLVYNGELYNYVALRQELEQSGERFVSKGDTEVLLRSVARSWLGALPRLNGMFGFAAWDRRREALLLARDPLGEKPLFYATPEPGMLVFGSEVKAVLQHPRVDRTLDVSALRQALRFRSVYGASSLYAGVRQLEPGTFLEFTRRGLRQGRYFDLVSEASALRDELSALSVSELVARGEWLLEKSVRERLIADVPVGVFLSGGVDSSLIAALMCRVDSRRVRSYSVGFEEDDFSELPHARAVAEAMGTEHVEILVGQSDYVERLVELTACRDAPLSEPADVAIACMSRVARNTVKVVLSGEGADEVFGGYPKYRFAAAPFALRLPVRMLGPAGTAVLAGRLGLDRRRSLVAARALSLPHELDRLVQWFSYLDRTDLTRLLPGLGWSDEDWTNTTNPQRLALSRASTSGALARMQIVDCLTWLPGNMLERGDRMTMAEGLEARPPFLDKQLAAFGLALPARLKLGLRAGKWIVRQWARRCLPEQIMRRKKWGFRVPLAQWFRGCMREMLFGYLTARDGLCSTFGNRKRVSALLDVHDRATADAHLQLWTLLVAEIWYQGSYKSYQ